MGCDADLPVDVHNDTVSIGGCTVCFSNPQKYIRSMNGIEEYALIADKSEG
jgi:hypothetical protein